MKSARVAAALSALVLLTGCQPTDQRKMTLWLSRGLPRPFANCIAERTFDALTREQEHELWLATIAHYNAMPETFRTGFPRTLEQAQAAIVIDLPEDLAQRVRQMTARCRIHNWRLR